MAFETLHLLLFFTTLLYTCINFNSAKPSTFSSTNCPSFDCGNGLKMSYPFWLKNQQSQSYCGYQGFGLSCNGDTPILTLSNHLDYNVKNFNKSEKTFTVTYVNYLHDPSCPVAPHDVVLNTPSLMNYTDDDKMLHFFYNCSLYPPSVQDIKCLRFNAPKHSYVFADGAIPEFDWERYCESIVKVAVIESTNSSGDVLGDLLVKGFGRALFEGFKVTWKPDLACQSCEATGGFCGLRTIKGIGQKFICFCSDGQQPFHCHDSGTVSISNEPNYVTIGALIFGGLIIVSTILYQIQKKNIGMKIQGFRQIVSSEK
ncbi:hypothetical protein ACH5RR_031010 [Cinchona calisaya]|uniref:non-specific serine/threonine protein kinase n=1 Tax=Cinchona calisaya TaxID=153742 RepID=A0ABD2YF12_9GENT